MLYCHHLLFFKSYEPSDRPILAPNFFISIYIFSNFQGKKQASVIFHSILLITNDVTDILNTV